MTLSGADRLADWLARLLHPAARAGPLPERLEHIVLGGSRRYTRAEVEALAGVDGERSQRLWRALGFADVSEDDIVFTDADVAALTLIDGLVGSGFIDPTLEAAAARA